MDYVIGAFRLPWVRIVVAAVHRVDILACATRGFDPILILRRVTVRSGSISIAGANHYCFLLFQDLTPAQCTAIEYHAAFSFNAAWPGAHIL